LQVEWFDKGGVGEVIFSLAKNIEHEGTLRPVVFVVSDRKGYLEKVARRQGLRVVVLGKNVLTLRWFIRILRIRLANLHYATFGADEYVKAKVPIVYTIHNTYIWADPSFVDRWSEEFSHVSKFIAVSSNVSAFFSRRFKIDPSRIITIANGLNVDSITSDKVFHRRSFDLDDSRFG